VRGYRFIYSSRSPLSNVQGLWFSSESSLTESILSAAERFEMTGPPFCFISSECEKSFRIGLISMGVKLHTTLFKTRIAAVRKARPFSLEGLFRADDFLTIALERLV
jgi:hypothetical protein